MTSTEKKQLEAALQALRIIHTWASMDADLDSRPDLIVRKEPREQAMREIANMAAKGLGRKDLMK